MMILAKQYLPLSPSLHIENTLPCDFAVRQDMLELPDLRLEPTIYCQCGIPDLINLNFHYNAIVVGWENVGAVAIVPISGSFIMLKGIL